MRALLIDPELVVRESDRSCFELIAQDR